MKKIISLLLVAVFCLSLMGFRAATAAAIDCGASGLSAKQQLQCGSCGAAGDTTCDTSGAGGNLQGTVSSVVNLLSIIGGVAAVIMIIIGGLRYVTSAGNADAAKNAKNTILYAVIGLVIVALAQLLVHFVLNQTSVGTGTANPPSGSSGTSGVSQGAQNSPH